MFVSENVRALFKKATLKLVKDDDTVLRVVDATCHIEYFTPDLARELGEDIAEHLFAADNSIRPEIEPVGLRVKAGLQNVTVRRHEELKPVALIPLVKIRDVEVFRQDDEKAGTSWLSCTFVLNFHLTSRVAREFTLNEFGNLLCLTFEHAQQAIDLRGSDEPVESTAH